LQKVAITAQLLKIIFLKKFYGSKKESKEGSKKDNKEGRSKEEEIIFTSYLTKSPYRGFCFFSSPLIRGN